ncbi:carbohydrate ABC transporter permease [Paenibacillus alba]|uniref:Sugar ABC transporter permease n=1 Tax=Paenibacillus alba TaxID=1197127 RepID=A0ABU6GD47_9BACL|nr:sugar ABC transporter permease [Paenibacillus alba]MEC0232130.1 sugar ABC transporter permease [Paenibacillus alba]
MHKVLGDKRWIALLITPGLFFFIFLICVPICVSVFYSLTNWDGISNYQMVGLQNYVEVLTADPVFWKALWHSLLLGVLAIIIQHPIAIFLAVLIQHAGRLERPMRTILFIPSIISAFVTSQLWVSIFSTQLGLINRILDQVGLSNWKQDWLGDPVLSILCIIFVVMWQGFGYGFLLYYSGLKGIPKEIHEAAIIDGATTLRYTINISLPMITPIIRIAIVLAVIAGFKQIETVYLMTGGGPANNSQFIAMYLYSKAFREALYGYGNAISVLFVTICLGITVVLNTIIKKDVGEY